MAAKSDLHRGERMLSLFLFLAQNFQRRFTARELMGALEIPDSEIRNVQRDLQSMISIPGNYVVREEEPPRVFYRCGLRSAQKLAFPDMENSLVDIAFLKRIAGLYPATAELIDDLVSCIQKSLSPRDRDLLDELLHDMHERILFMGARPDIQEDATKFLELVLKAIRDKRKIETLYCGNTMDKPVRSVRIPLFVVIFQGDIYIGCASQVSADRSYFIKLRRVFELKILKEKFKEDPVFVNDFRERIVSSGGMLGGQHPEISKVVFRAPKYFGVFLKERPYVRTLKIEPDGKSFIKVTMNVEINYNFIQWLVGFMDDVVVLEPQKLKDRLADLGKFFCEHYAK